MTEITRLAAELMQQHGNKALAVAGKRIADAYASGDMIELARWVAVMDELDELQRMVRRPEDTAQ